MNAYAHSEARNENLSFKLRLELLDLSSDGLGWVVRLRSNIRMWDLGLRGEYPQLGSFLEILARIYASFEDNNG